MPGGPILVEGPVDMTTPDGHRVCSDRFVVAVCACRRSKNYPLCDTSHRRKVRPTDTEDAQGGPPNQKSATPSRDPLPLWE